MKTRKELVVELAAALLASGHYTESFDEDNDGGPIKFDIGEDYKEEGEPMRWISHAVSDAIGLEREITKQLNREEELKKSDENQELHAVYALPKDPTGEAQVR